ncbi:MAG: hypothetical protein JWQ69_5879, partial [Pseudomonas sp.]|nr:hypothetical protein [Pseudomonas sp.]
MSDISKPVSAPRNIEAICYNARLDLHASCFNNGIIYDRIDTPELQSPCVP